MIGCCLNLTRSAPCDSLFSARPPTWFRADHRRIVQPCRNGSAGSFGDLEPNRLPRLALDDRGALLDLPGREHVRHLELDEVPAAQLAVDCKVEQRKISGAVRDLEAQVPHLGATLPLCGGADPSAYAIGAVYTGADGAMGSTPVEVIGDVVDSLKAEYLAGAAWMMPRKVRNLVRDLKDSQGRFYFQPSLYEGVPDRLMGYPVFLAEDMDAPAADTVGMFFGNFAEAYTVVDRTGMQVIRDPFSSPGNVKFYVAKRVGGALTNPEAVKALVLGSEPI